MDDLKNDIEKYLTGELTPNEMHQLERRALNDPFLADAIEGAQQAGPENFAADAAHITSRISKKLQARSSWFTPLRVAASIVVLLTASVTLYIVYFRNPLALSDAVSTPKRPIQPLPRPTDLRPAMPPKEAQKDLLTYASRKKREVSAPQKQFKKPALEPAPASVASAAGPPVSSEGSTRAREENESLAEEVVDASKQQPSAAPAQALSGTSVARASKISSDERSDRFENDSGKKIRGRVSLPDGSTAGVKVGIKGTGITTQTDANGHYEIPAGGDKSQQSLIYSSHGFQTTEVDARHMSSIDVQLSGTSGKPLEIVIETDTSYHRDEPSKTLASPVGGDKAFNRYVDANLRYPARAINKRVQGKVLVSFIVKEDSSLADFRIVDGIGSGCDDELVRLIKAGPKWAPMFRSEKPFDSKVLVRLTFVLPHVD